MEVRVISRSRAVPSEADDGSPGSPTYRPEASGGAAARHTETKVCTRCDIEKSIEDFPFRYDKKRPAHLRQSQCKKCKNRYRATRLMQVGYDLKIYGLTAEQFDEMLAAQGGGCKLCGKLCGTGKRLAVDHCHETGRIRGLLCMRCNTALGALGDTVEALEAVLEYLRPPTM